MLWVISWEESTQFKALGFGKRKHRRQRKKYTVKTECLRDIKENDVERNLRTRLFDYLSCLNASPQGWNN